MCKQECGIKKTSSHATLSWCDKKVYKTRSGFIRKSQSAEAKYPAGKFWIYRNYFFSFGTKNFFQQKKKWNCFLIEWLNPSELGLKRCLHIKYVPQNVSKQKDFRGCHGSKQGEEKVLVVALERYWAQLNSRKTYFLKL